VSAGAAVVADDQHKPGLPLHKTILPRAEGARWVFSTTFFEDGQAESGGITIEEVVMSLEIGGVTCFQVKSTYDWRSFMDRLLGVSLDAEDVWYYWEYVDASGSHDHSVDSAEAAPKSLDDFELTLPYPVEVGHQYQIDTSEYEVIDVERVVESPAGTFKCVVYQILWDECNEPTRERLYLAPGVGVVRWEMDEKTESGWVLSMRDELLRYDLGALQAKADADSQPAADLP
jgi:hypothetical protein